MLAECDSDETIAAVGHALQERHQVVFIESDDKAYGRLKRQRPHLVFNIAERVVGPNRESHIPTVCEMLDIPYTGSDPLTLGLCLDKSRAKEILTYHRVPNPAFWIVESAAAIPAGVRLPAIVKPLYRGLEQGHQEQFPRPQPRRALRARRRGRRDLQAAGHRRAVPRRPRVHRRRPGERPELRDPAHRRDRPRAAPGRARRPSIRMRRSGSGTPVRSRSTSSSARRPSPASSGPRSRTSSPAPAASCASGTGAGSTSGSTRRASPTSSRSILCRASCPAPRTIPVCPRRPGPPGIPIRT